MTTKRLPDEWLEDIYESGVADAGEVRELIDEIRSLRAPREVEEAREALRDARAALDHDRTGLAAALNVILNEVKGRRWMRPGGDGDEGGTWGSYDYREQTIATLRKEIGWAFDAISRHATGALVASGKLADAAVRAADEALTGRRRALSSPSGEAPDA